MRFRAHPIPVLLLVVCAGCGGDEPPPGTGRPSDSATTPIAEPDAPTGPDGAAAASSDDATFAALRNSVCDTIDNSFDCARAIEARRLPGADRVERRGDTLLLRLHDGDALPLVDRSGGRPAAREYHSFQGHWVDQLGGEGRRMCDRPAALFRRGGTWHLQTGDDAR